MPIVNWWNYKSVYLGQIAPTIWHNSTTILVMPVVILLFSASSRWLGAPTTRNATLTSGLCVLSAAIKPSYAIALLFVLVPWYCYIALKTTGMSLLRLVGHIAILLGPVIGTLLIQWLLIASYTAITIAPFGVWSLYSPNPIASLMLSLAFPLAVSILYRGCWRGNVGFVLAWAVFAVALMEFILLAEEGVRFNHANFLWGPCMALCVPDLCGCFLSAGDVSPVRVATDAVLGAPRKRSLFLLEDRDRPGLYVTNASELAKWMCFRGLAGLVRQFTL
jgi:hypothetical protein